MSGVSITSQYVEIVRKSENLERVKGIEPSSQAWEAHVLPLNHTRDGRDLPNRRHSRNRFDNCGKLPSRLNWLRLMSAGSQPTLDFDQEVGAFCCFEGIDALRVIRASAR